MPPSLAFQGGVFELLENESVLDCLLRNNVDIPHSCKSGACQSCLLQATGGAVTAESQEGLKSAFKKSNHFLSCRCLPAEDLAVRLPDDSLVSIPATVIDRQRLNRNIFRIRLKTTSPIDCFPGQYVTLINPDQVARSYSIANQPDQDGHLELHIRLIPGGLMSQWIADDSCLGSSVTVRGPAGNCFYVPEDGQDHPLVMACTGTGLAPLYGILLEALTHRHRGPIALYHGALASEDLYFQDVLGEIAREQDHVTYVPCVLNGTPPGDGVTGNIEDVVMNRLPDGKTTRLYLCGAPDFVNSLKKKAFLSGLASSHILADAFLPTKGRP